MKTTPLHMLPKKTPLRVTVGKSKEVRDAVFYRLDGMYSYCTLDTGEVFFLGASTPMVEVEGRWEVHFDSEDS